MMGNHRCLCFHIIFTFAFLVADTYTCLGDRNTSVGCSEKERLALLKFKNSVEDPSGMLSSWIGNDCCLWEGIHCDATVDRLHLRGCWDYDRPDDGCYLRGNEVSSSLAELSHLKHLDLSGNDFEGSQTPKFIGSLKHLTYLNLSHSGFQGIIPHHVGNLSNLKVLDLRSNVGLVSNDITWTFDLSSLEYLDLSFVDLGGSKNMGMVFYMISSLEVLSLSWCKLSNTDVSPFLNSSRILPNIKHLDLSKNNFKGPLPRFFQNMSSLTFLDLSHFNLSLSFNFANLLSLVPSISELHLSECGLDNTRIYSPRFNSSTLSNIQHLDLSSNAIEGIFPSFLTNMTSLRVLDLSRNKLNSSVPIMPNLLDLDLSSNKFRQITDIGIWRQCQLKQLHASNNHFRIEMVDSPKNISECSQYALELLDLTLCSNGTIPKPLGRLANLRGLYISRSGLTGPIPESLGRLRYLEELDLSYNQLNGLLPESLENLVALTDLDLSFNHLTGPIRASLGRLVSLQAISLGSNLLNETIPASVGQLAKLHYLDFSNNSLEGVVFETHFSNLSMLKHLDISSNTNLIFNVSHEWIPPFQLADLHLRSCSITNEFPQWLRHQRKLYELVLSNTTIWGALPIWFRKMPIIPYLDLSHNKLSGPLTNLPMKANDDQYGFVSVLFLENNLFNGSIPKAICKTNLEYIDLSKNRLTGKIPKCFGNMQGMYNLILSSNHISGSIPSYIAIDSLEELKLDDNNFIGELPREFGNLRALKVLDVGNNKLSGNLTKWVEAKLTYLVVLRLHNNNFTGRIPLFICKFSNLQILDVAHNNFEGPIPRCIGELNAMINNNGSGISGDPSLGNIVNLDQVMKGFDLEYLTNWGMLFNIDLSSNKLVGEIPVELTALSMLMGLNLSNNNLSGGIPNSIGNMMNLVSLDLSRNKLAGVIPPSIGDLTFLSHLNLSHNNLSGRIPTGRQLQTLIDPSIYAWNKDLCGAPLPKSCSNSEGPTTSKKNHEATNEKTNVWLFCVDIISGFATGFWGIIGVLLFKKQWRQKLFMFAEKTMDKIYIAVVVRFSKIKRGRESI